MNKNRTRSVWATCRQDYLLVILVLLLVACSNVGLINNRLAIKNAVGVNLFGLRDLLFCLLSIAAVPRISRMNARELFSPLVSITVVCVTYSVALAGHGISQGYPIRDIAYELIIFLTWLVGFPVLSLLRMEASARAIALVFIALGAIIAFGVIAEIIFRVPLVSGSSSSITYSRESLTSLTLRPVPTGWIFLTASTTFLMARVMFGADAKAIHKTLLLALILFELIAGILTQTRSIQIVCAASISTLCYLKGRRSLLYVTLIMCLALGSWSWALDIGNSLLGDNFSSGMSRRYSVFADSGDLTRYNEKEVRPQQISAFLEMPGSWAVFGSSLGEPLTSVNPQMPAGIDYTDVCFIYLITRLGLLGGIFVIIFASFAVNSVLWIKKDPRPSSWVVNGFVANLIGVLAAAWVANVWGYSYFAIPVTVMFFTAYALRRRIRSPYRRAVRTPASLVSALGAFSK